MSETWPFLGHFSYGAEPCTEPVTCTFMGQASRKHSTRQDPSGLTQKSIDDSFVPCLGKLEGVVWGSGWDSG